VFRIYLGTALVAGVLLIIALATDQANEERLARETLALQAEVRADYFARHLGLLATELRRLGLRSEINLLDQNLEPEQSLLRLSHSKSTFFNVGVAIVGVDGRVVWSEPQSFMEPGSNLGGEPWFESVRTMRTIRYVPVAPEREHDSLVFVVSPIVRANQFNGALVGAVDLSSAEAVEGVMAIPEGRSGRTVLSTRDGRVVYPPKPPFFSTTPAWDRIFQSINPEGFVSDVQLEQRTTIVAGAPVRGSDLVLLSLTPADVLFAPSRHRLLLRLGFGLALALMPNLLLLFQLRRVLTVFRRSEEDALRDERLRFLGEAENLNAHEVKNALNGIRLGLDLIMARERSDSSPRQRAAEGLRREVERLSEFTSELLTFSKGVVPRPISLNLSEFVERVTQLLEERAKESCITLEVVPEGPEIRVRADPSLVHVVVSNLVGNALEAVAVAEVSSPRVRVSIENGGDTARVIVADNGAGVVPAMKHRLFEPFSTTKPSGVGIGLALSRKIARAHGGELALMDSEVGARFLFTLPLEKRS
jgi:two-component system C4-dicarboxylate transport sensor histidine kinase DctB